MHYSFWKDWLKFLLISTDEHGVHSPFVYDLVTKCFYNKKKLQTYTRISHFRKEIEISQEKVTVPKTNSSATSPQKISQVFEKWSVSANKQRLLHRLMLYFEFKNAVVIDGILGGEIISLCRSKDTAIYTFEKFPKATKKLLSNEKFSLPSNLAFKKDFREIEQQKIDFVYMNTCFDPQNTYQRFLKILPFLHNDSVVLINPIHRHGIRKYWEWIKNNPKVVVTIDTFTWGFVFFRKEQAKEHFKIRI